MQYGICNLSIVQLRLEPTDCSEMVSQVIFGEHFTVLEKDKKWSKIKLHFDNYEGFIDNKQYQTIPVDIYQTISEEKPHFSGELIDFITDKKNQLTTIPIGARLPLFNNEKFTINKQSFSYEGKVHSGKLDKSAVVKMAFLFLNSPYLWGGKTPFGIDCSGLTQMTYKINGHQLLRNASEQATQGEALSFIEESEPGDLAFFDNKDGIIDHVGIIMQDNYIIHAHGKVRIDRIDHTGIFNNELKNYTHKLRVIKKII